MHIKKISTVAPVLAAVVIAACAGVSLASYTPNVYAVTPKEAAELKNQSGDTEPETTPDAQVFDLPDGTYEGTGTGYAGSITVSVEIKDKKIVAINVLNVEADDEAFFNRAKAVIDRIIQSQSLEVDVVSGATYSSNGIISAVKNALTGEKDSGKTAAADAGKGQGTTEVAQVADAAAYKDGTYYGTATGFGGPMKVKVVISGGKIASIDVVENKDDASYFNRAKSLIAKIISGQTTNVDTVSGATYSSAGIINAVRNALTQAAVSGTSDAQGTLNNASSGTTAVTPGAAGKFPYKDGVYNGTGFGYGGDISVSVVIQNKTIKAILITDAKDEDETFFNRAKVVADNVVTAQSTNVDTVSGATYSSKGILEAIKNALAEAEKATNGSNGNGNNGNSTNGSGNNGNSNNTNNGNTNNGNNSNGSGNENNNGNGSGNNGNAQPAMTYADGTYTIVVPCVPDEDEDFEPYNLIAKITIKNDRIVSVADVSGDGDSGNDKYIKWAANGRSSLTGMIAQVLGLSREETTEDKIASLDTVSRATCSSKSIREACLEALKKAKEAFQK